LGILFPLKTAATMRMLSLALTTLHLVIYISAKDEHGDEEAGKHVYDGSLEGSNVALKTGRTSDTTCSPLLQGRSNQQKVEFDIPHQDNTHSEGDAEASLLSSREQTDAKGASKTWKEEDNGDEDAVDRDAEEEELADSAAEDSLVVPLHDTEAKVDSEELVKSEDSLGFAKKKKGTEAALVAGRSEEKSRKGNNIPRWRRRNGPNQVWAVEDSMVVPDRQGKGAYRGEGRNPRSRSNRGALLRERHTRTLHAPDEQPHTPGIPDRQGKGGFRGKGRNRRAPRPNRGFG